MSPSTTARVVQTARDTDDRLSEKPELSFAGPRDESVPAVLLNPRTTYQRIEGFGGAFTEAGAYVLSKISPEDREAVLKAYFDPATGHNYSLCRTHINSCDFSLGNYAYHEAGGDYELAHFDIAHDRELLIPYIKDALKVHGSDFKLLASPWSPPGWMKTNGEMNNGGQLRKDCLETWALYFAKYIKAYKAEGITVWGVTVQNEPEATQPWESCLYTDEEERDFIKYYLGPRLQADGLFGVRILIWDHNKDRIARRVGLVLADEVAAKLIWGIGFHWYAGDDFDQLERVHQMFPDKRLLSTEACQEGGVRLGDWGVGERYGHAMIGDLNHWAVGWIDWNMVLNQAGGPNHVNNFCDAPVIVNTKSGEIHYQSSFYYIGHFSRFITPGAVRVEAKSESKQLEVTAFRNPDGELTAIVMNAGDEEVPFQLCQEAGAASTTAPAPGHSITTYVVEP